MLMLIKSIAIVAGILISMLIGFVLLDLTVDYLIMGAQKNDENAD